MLPALLKKIKNTNEKIIFVNEHGEPQGVLLSYKEYYEQYQEKQKQSQKQRTKRKKTATGLTSRALLDKINREIAQWKEHQNPAMLDVDYFDLNEPDNKEKNAKNEEKNPPEDEPLYLEDVDELWR